MKIDNRQGPKRVFGRQGRSLIPLAIAILVVLGLIFGGWGTVYAAQNSEPDDFLYPVKVATDYLAELTVDIISVDEAPVPEQAVSIQRQDRDLDQGMTNVDESVLLEKQHQYRYGYEAPIVVELAEPILDDIELPIDDTLITTPTITATQTMSGSLWSWGPGPCYGDPEYCELTVPYGYTYTHGVDGDAPFQGDPPLGDPGSIEHPEPSLGPGESPVKEVQEPEGNTGSTSEQKKAGKP